MANFLPVKNNTYYGHPLNSNAECNCGYTGTYIKSSIKVLGMDQLGLCDIFICPGCTSLIVPREAIVKLISDGALESKE